MDRARKAVESLYTDTCTVYIKAEVTDPNTHITSFEETAVLESKCRLSFSTLSATKEGNADTVKQVTKLFIAPEIEIPPGSKIEVTRQGKAVSYKQSGQPAIYPTHQEIVLELFERYA